MPFVLRENTLAIYSPKNYIIPKADPVTIDTEIAVNLPEHSTLFVTTKFKGQKIKVVRGPVQKKRLRLTLLNTSYFHTSYRRQKQYRGVRAQSKLQTDNSQTCQKEKNQATEGLRTENVELEKILAADVDRQADR